MTNRKFWTKEQLDYLIENYKDKNMNHLIEYLGKSYNSIRLKASRLNLPKRSSEIDMKYFMEIDSEEKAYWLGFIYADGYIIERKEGSEFGLELSIVDIGHLSKLKESLNSNTEITTRVRSTGLEMCSFRIYKKEFVNTLKIQGIITNKSLTKTFPTIKKELIRHFIRGYFDGNGYIGFTKSESIKVALCSGSREFLKELIKIISSELDFKREYIPYQSDVNVYNFIPTNKHDINLFLDFIYKNSSLYLERKLENYIIYKKKVA